MNRSQKLTILLENMIVVEKAILVYFQVAQTPIYHGLVIASNMALKKLEKACRINANFQSDSALVSSAIRLEKGPIVPVR